jgi:DNA-binding transcriptional MerR regulator
VLYTDSMKPNELARLLNISPATLRRWAGSEYTEFLSPNGAGRNGARRSFGDVDARIMSLVAEMKARNTPPADITAALRSAQADNWRNLPPLQGMIGDESVALVPREAANSSLKALQTMYAVLVQERDNLRARLDTAQEEKAVLQRRITELSEEAAELRGMMQQYTFGGRRVNVATLVVVALVAGVLLALIIVVLAAIIPR